MAQYGLRLPLDENAIRSLKVRDALYLTGDVYTIRDMAYERILSALDSGDSLPFDLRGGAIWHCGPITKKEGERWIPVSVGSTTSSRFTSPASKLVESLGVRLILGKGFLGTDASSVLAKFGAAYLVTTGGSAAYYARQIEEIRKVYWLDLGMPAAVWLFKVKRLGPLIVGMDTDGGSLEEERKAAVDASVSRILKNLEIDPGHRYLWWP